MWTAKYLRACALSSTRGTWPARCPVRGSVLEVPDWGSPEPLVFPRHRPGRSAQSQTQPLLFYSFLVLLFSMLDSPSRTGWPSWKRTRGRLPPARLAKTRCETSGYNTGPGRCSDPSCLVLQPEGHRSAARAHIAASGLVKTAQRWKEGPTRARGGCGARRVAPGSPPPSALGREPARCRAPPQP